MERPADGGRKFGARIRAALIRTALAAAAFACALAPARAEAPTPESKPAAAAKPGAPIAVEARLREAGTRARLEFDLSEETPVTAFALAEPDRIVVELPEVNFQIDPAVGRAPGGRRGVRGKAEGLVESFRFGQFAPGKSRIVIDLARPARIERATAQSIAGGKPARLTIELSAATAEQFRANVRPAAAPPASAGVAPPPAAPGQKPLVIIDPGHGGVDSGAYGRSGLVEKDVVFEFARDLARKIEAGGKLRAAMTRESDVFVSLDERVRIARASGAALLVSVHADSIKDAAGVAGATVYTMADRASDAEAARIAESENAADRAAGADLTESAGDVADILSDLTRRETRAFAHLYARSLVGYLSKATRLNKNPNRSAGFKVLKAPDIPSVLLELGYLSSEKDAQAMASPEWREKATQAVARSVEAFFAEPGTRQTEAVDATTTSTVAGRGVAAPPQRR